MARRILKAQIESLAEQLLTVDLSPTANLEITAREDGGLDVTVRDHWGIDHLIVARTGLVTARRV